MTTIYLIRHAEAEGNLHRRIHGWYDALITDNGFLQIKALEARFQSIPVDVVFSSDLYRTMTTARAVYRPKQLTLHTHSGLREINMGDWEDVTWGAARHLDPVAMGQFNKSSPQWIRPNGESFAQAGARVEAAVREITLAHPNQTVAIFTHGTVIRQLLANIKGLSPADWHTLHHFENTAVTCLHYESEAFSIAFEGDASHLDDSISTLGRQAWWRKDHKIEDVNLWFRPIQWEQEQALYLAARQEAWRSTHGPEIPFVPAGFLQDATAHLTQSPWGVTLAMAGDEVAGILQVDDAQYQAENAGYIPFCYIMPQRRDQQLGIQLIGQAIAFFRPLGRDKLRLRCAPYNHRAQHFYTKYGFIKVGEDAGSRVPLDILEKYIGYQR